jgi:hypothetical protein
MTFETDEFVFVRNKSVTEMQNFISRKFAALVFLLICIKSYNQSLSSVITILSTVVTDPFVSLDSKDAGLTSRPLISGAILRLLSALFGDYGVDAIHCRQDSF